MHKLDHVVFGASTLEEGTEFVESILQEKLSDIGYHKDMGTHNRVIKISDKVYLEVVAINPEMQKIKKRRWFNLDNPDLQKKLKKSPQIIGYVVEKNNKTPQEYYDPFFNASRANYRWKFAMPNYRNNDLDIEIIEKGIIPSLISWKGEKPIYKMKKNQFDVINFDIKLSESQQRFNNILKSIGEMEHVSVLPKFKKNTSNFKLRLRDNLRDIVISL